MSLALSIPPATSPWPMDRHFNSVRCGCLAFCPGETRGQTAWRSDASQSQAESRASLPDIPVPVKSSAEQVQPDRIAEAASDKPMSQPQDQVCSSGLRLLLPVLTWHREILSACGKLSWNFSSYRLRCQSDVACPDAYLLVSQPHVSTNSLSHQAATRYLGARLAFFRHVSC